MSEKYTLKYTGSEMDELLDGANSLSGIIVMWSGAINKIPTGWLLCDGTNGTPDLRNRFIVGAGTDYSVGNTGGSSSVVLTTSQMPNHSHTATTTTTGNHQHTIWYNTYGASSTHHNALGVAGNAEMYAASSARNKSTYVNTDSGSYSVNSTQGAHTHTINVVGAGGGAAHENRPPYYALAYIMKA